MVARFHTLVQHRHDHSDMFTRLSLMRYFMLLTAVGGWWVLSRLTQWQVEGGWVGVIIATLLGHSLWLYKRVLRQRSTSADWLSHIIIDGAAVLVMTGLTGGTANPFIYYLLVLVAISATIFSWRASWLFCVFCVLGYSLLFIVDIGTHYQYRPDEFQLHLLGMWLNFTGSAILVTFFVSRLAGMLRDQQQELAKAREDTLKSEQLAGIGTLAATTVHALATPLSTLSIMLGEALAESDSPATQKDTRVMLGQIDRCKSIMDKLSALAEQDNQESQREPVSALFTDIKEHFSISQPSRPLTFDIESSCETASADYSLLLRHALINLINNALDAANTQVTVLFRCRGSQLHLVIEDDGAGFPDSVTSVGTKTAVSTKEAGLGIGLFLANSTIERLGGSLQAKRQPVPGDADLTVLTVQLPLSGDPS